MPFPPTRDALVAGGYVFSNHARCKGCGQEIEWWTTPRGRKMPLNLMQEGSSAAASHFSDCPDEPLFRRDR